MAMWEMFGGWAFFVLVVFSGVFFFFTRGKPKDPFDVSDD